jgi:anti-sigma regulatory factor (Ser/Thr protein kinase)
MRIDNPEVIMSVLESSENTIQVLSSSPTWVSLAVPCRMEHVDTVLSVLEPRAAQLDERRHDELCVAVREMLMNAIEHGGEGNPNRNVNVSCVVTHDALLVHIQDPGDGFAGKDLRHAAVGNADSPIEHLEFREQHGIRPGGFGILMARTLVDELIYNEKGNEVLLIKKLHE